MRIVILTLFPDYFANLFSVSLIGKAIASGKANVDIVQIRDFAHDTQRTTDDRPFGGGPGMVMKVEPIALALESVKASIPTDQKVIVLLTSAQGKMYTQQDAREFATQDVVIIICGHYEGVDERVARYLSDEEISIGDYVLTGGELPAMVIIDAITRLLPGVLGNVDSNRFESFENNMLEYPQYTRPAVFKGKKVPAVLMTGDHGLIAAWRKKEAIKITKKVRPDMVMKNPSSFDSKF